ncbi:MAG: DedA family protein [Actinomycetota bacterium]|nr:DedA family protein [Actinomycetota bacterium]
MNLFDANSIVSDLGLVGVLAIIFAETGLLVGLAFPGDSLLFIAGVAASGSGAALLGNASLNPVLLFLFAPVAAITGGIVGYFFGEKYGRKLFDRPDGRIFTQQKVITTEKWLRKYGTGKALILARFVPFVRTLINPMCGVVGIDKKVFLFYNAIGGLIWTESVIALGFILGERLEGSVDAYLLPVIGVIIFASLVPVFIEIFREWQTRKHHK